MSARDNDPWQYKARCIGEDPELFFPIGETGPYALQIEEAKRVCRKCLVRDACLEEALNFSAEGIWGATTMRERNAISRYRKREQKLLLAQAALAKQAG